MNTETRNEILGYRKRIGELEALLRESFYTVTNLRHITVARGKAYVNTELEERRIELARRIAAALTSDEGCKLREELDGILENSLARIDAPLSNAEE